MFLVRRAGFVGWMAGSVALLLACGCSSGGSPNRLPGLAAQAGSAGGGQAAAPPLVKGTVTRDSDAGASDPTVSYAVTLTMSSFTVPAGAEVYKCQDFANPFGGDAVDVKEWDIAMNLGSHHMTLFNLPDAADGTLIDCPSGGLMAGVYSIGSQNAKLKFDYPDGIGEAIPAGMGFTMNSHYVNSGSMPIEGVVSVTARVAAPGVVTQHAGAEQFVLLSIEVPPTKQPVTVGSSCALPQDMNVFRLGPHMHYRAMHYTASMGGNTLYTTDQWEEPSGINFSPPLQLKAGTELTWSCDYTNETDQPLTYGASAIANVMCNTVMWFYPVQDLNDPLLTCRR
jgi:hypothetical protein